MVIKDDRQQVKKVWLIYLRREKIYQTGISAGLI
jgi:hypothetical protein